MAVGHLGGIMDEYADAVMELDEVIAHLYELHREKGDTQAEARQRVKDDVQRALDNLPEGEE